MTHRSVLWLQVVLQTSLGLVGFPAVRAIQQHLLQLRLLLPTLLHVVHVAHDAGEGSGTALKIKKHLTSSSPIVFKWISFARWKWFTSLEHFSLPSLFRILRSLSLMTRSSRSLASSEDGWKQTERQQHREPSLKLHRACVSVTSFISETWLLYLTGMRADQSHQVTVVGHDVILHPRRGLQLFPTVLTGKGLLHANN